MTSLKQLYHYHFVNAEGPIDEVQAILSCFSESAKLAPAKAGDAPKAEFPANFARISEFLTAAVFNRYHTEHEMLRYIKRLEALESIANVQRGRFTPLSLPQRAVVEARLPAIEFVDLDRERAADGLTPSLVEALRRTIARGRHRTCRCPDGRRRKVRSACAWANTARLPKSAFARTWRSRASPV